ncbi:Endoplasmic reticulum aminopeptidase 1-like protein [Aphelenchoides fujianensis]|nr:Endoplasmic reticulum aminopeptidase 1-like protein [Aphelenchoides fujianensis]
MNSKLDLIAFPKFYGSMENQGAIVLRDTLLFFDEHTHSLEFKRSAFHSVAHQCAHQWFGDLLSNRRWTEMFLSESLAHFFEHQIYANLTGDDLLLRFASAEEGLLFDEDHLLPVVKETKSESTPFTTLIHNKVLSPAALFHSLQILMDRREFRGAVREYVDANQFGAVELHDLYAAFAPHANFPYETSNGSRSIGIREFADRFLFQASFPVFVVNQTNNETIVSVRPFHDPHDLPPSPFDHSWLLPLLVDRAERSELVGWLTDEQPTYSPSASLPVVVNPDRLVYARVLYDEGSWLHVLHRWEKKEISEGTRAALLADTLAFIK